LFTIEEGLLPRRNSFHGFTQLTAHVLELAALVKAQLVCVYGLLLLLLLLVFIIIIIVIVIDIIIIIIYYY